VRNLVYECRERAASHITWKYNSMADFDRREHKNRRIDEIGYHEPNSSYPSPNIIWVVEVDENRIKSGCNAHRSLINAKTVLR
jgi:hypothetical protein